MYEDFHAGKKNIACFYAFKISLDNIGIYPGSNTYNRETRNYLKHAEGLEIPSWTIYGTWPIKKEPLYDRN